MTRPLKTLGGAAIIVAALVSCFALAQATPPLSICAGEVDVAARMAVPGDRAEGWRGQSRAEVMAPHAAPATAGTAPPAHGFYRAGSDHRKDGQAVGW
jgi:gamma-glutamyltranspeptidase / glutathione hydrolase